MRLERDELILDTLSEVEISRGAVLYCIKVSGLDIDDPYLEQLEELKELLSWDMHLQEGITIPENDTIGILDSDSSQQLLGCIAYAALSSVDPIQRSDNRELLVALGI